MVGGGWWMAHGGWWAVVSGQWLVDCGLVCGWMKSGFGPTFFGPAAELLEFSPSGLAVRAASLYVLFGDLGVDGLPCTCHSSLPCCCCRCCSSPSTVLVCAVFDLKNDMIPDCGGDSGVVFSSCFFDFSGSAGLDAKRLLIFLSPFRSSDL